MCLRPDCIFTVSPLQHNKFLQYLPLRVLNLNTISAVTVYVDNSSICCELKKVTHCYNNSGIQQKIQCTDDDRKFKTTTWRLALGGFGIIITLSNMTFFLKKTLKRLKDKTERINVTLIVMMTCSILHGIYLFTIAVSPDQTLILRESNLHVSIKCKSTAYLVLLAPSLKYLTSIQYLAKITMVIYSQYKVSPQKLIKIADNILMVVCVIVIIVCAALIYVDDVIVYSGHLCHSLIFVSPVKYVVVAMLSTVLTIILFCAIGIIRLVTSTKRAAGRKFHTKMEKVLFVKTSLTVVVVFIDWAYFLLLLILSFSQVITNGVLCCFDCYILHKSVV